MTDYITDAMFCRSSIFHSTSLLLFLCNLRVNHDISSGESRGSYNKESQLFDVAMSPLAQLDRNETLIIFHRISFIHIVL